MVYFAKLAALPDPVVADLALQAESRLFVESRQRLGAFPRTGYRLALKE